MVPSLPSLLAIRAEHEQGRAEATRALLPPQQQQATTMAYPHSSASHPRLAPVHTLPQHFQHERQQTAVHASPASSALSLAWRHVKSEAEGHAYALHHEQLRSMTQHFVAPRHQQQTHQYGDDARTMVHSHSSNSSSMSQSYGQPHASVNSGARANRFSSDDDDDNDGRGDDECRGRFVQRSVTSYRSSVQSYAAAGSQMSGGGEPSTRSSFSGSEAFADFSISSTGGGGGFERGNGEGALTSETAASDEQFDPRLSKKARRKEQCRVNQANYRKRKRMYENELSGQIKLLEDEILELKARKIALRHQPMPDDDQLMYLQQQHQQQQIHERDPIQSIGDFYYALESAQLKLPLAGGSVQLHYPSLHSLFELQRQEFASIDAFRLQWLWYREQFAVFHLFVSSSERLDAGDQVIIRISAQLHIQMQQSKRGGRWPRRPQQYSVSDEADDNDDEDHWFSRKIVCPVLQQFEFHADERVLTQITSEIDWLAGVAALVQSQPEHTLQLLRELAAEASSNARYYDDCC